MPLDTGILPHLKPVLKGALSWIPGVRRAFYDANAAGGTGDVQYCYGVWLKHLALLWGAGMQRIPTTVAELGPGRSLGTGLAALLCGAERYGAIDAVRHASAATTTPVLEPMSTLFRERAPRPRKGWPDVDEMLDARLFPSHILTDELLERSLAAPRLAELGHAVRQLDAKEQHARLRYGTWRDAGHVVQEGEADLLFSQVVPSLVEDKETFYQCCARWLKPGGWMSHHIDFTSMGATNEWNGHLQYSEAVWKIIVGQRPFFVSRERLSSHVGLMQKYGFEIVSVARRTEEGGIDRSRLAPRWRDMSDDDLQCAHAFVIARKRG